MRITGSFDCIFPNYLCFDREEFDIDSIQGVPVQRKVDTKVDFPIDCVGYLTCPRIFELILG